jgi:hypothetical protein
LVTLRNLSDVDSSTLDDGAIWRCLWKI